jgi:hypothetical protein
MGADTQRDGGFARRGGNEIRRGSGGCVCALSAACRSLSTIPVTLGSAMAAHDSSPRGAWEQEAALGTFAGVPRGGVGRGRPAAIFERDHHTHASTHTDGLWSGRRDRGPAAADERQGGGG